MPALQEKVLNKNKIRKAPGYFWLPVEIKPLNIVEGYLEHSIGGKKNQTQNQQTPKKNTKLKNYL